jgi:hypothetical protein
VDSDPSILHRWRLLDGKLQLLDKTLAESKTELEIMKSYFSLFANKRTEYKQMSRLSRRTASDTSAVQHHKSMDSTNNSHTRYAVPMASITQVSSLVNLSKHTKLLTKMTMRSTDTSSLHTNGLSDLFQVLPTKKATKISQG